MSLINALPKNDEGNIILSPGGKCEDILLDGEVEIDWFVKNYPELANSEVPLIDENFAALKSIDDYWEQNAIQWRAGGFI